MTIDTQHISGLCLLKTENHLKMSSEPIQIQSYELYYPENVPWMQS
jgi:hypothetical protein